jgi:hypothetical protein
MAEKAASAVVEAEAPEASDPEAAAALLATEAALAEAEARALDVSVPAPKELTTVFGTVDHGTARAALNAVNANPAAFVYGGASMGCHVMPDAALPCAPVLAGLSSGSASNLAISKAARREYFAIFRATSHPLVGQMLSNEAKRRLRAMIVLGGPQVIASLFSSAQSFLRRIHAAGRHQPQDEELVEGLVADLLQAVAVCHDCWCAAFAVQAPARLGGTRLPPRVLAAATNAARVSLAASAGLPRPPLQLSSLGSAGSGQPDLSMAASALPTGGSQFAMLDSTADLSGATSAFTSAGFPPLPPLSSSSAFGASSTSMLRAAASERQADFAHAAPARMQRNGTTAIKGKDLPMRRLMMSYQRRGMTGSGTSRLGGPAKYVSLAGAPLSSGVRVSAKVLKRGRGDSDGSGGGEEGVTVTAAGPNQAVVATDFGGLDSLAIAAVPDFANIAQPNTVPVRAGAGTLPIAPPALDMQSLPGIAGGVMAPPLSSTATAPTTAGGWESVLNG